MFGPEKDKPSIGTENIYLKIDLEHDSKFHWEGIIKRKRTLQRN